MMHQTARQDLFPITRAKNIGTMMMYAVRGIFTRPERLAPEIAALVAAGQLPAEFAKKDNALDFLIHAAGASSLPDAAYRYVRHEPGVNICLFGTGSQTHLRENLTSIGKPPLSGAAEETPARVHADGIAWGSVGPIGSDGSPISF